MYNFFQRLLKDLDWLTLLSIFFIESFGLVTIASVAPNLFFQQLFFILVGFIFFFLLKATDYHLFQSISWPIYAFSLGFLLLTIALGNSTRGSTRWIDLWFFRVQASELIKPLIILFFAARVITNSPVRLANLLKLVVFFATVAFFIFKQPDLGSTIIYVITFLTLITVGGLHPTLIIVGSLLTLVIAPLVWFVLKPYQKTRLLSFLNPNLDPLGSGYNAIQATIAVGSGQFWGRGFGRGTQSHLLFLPEHHTDFIFASLSEEFGFFGGGLLILLYLFLLWRIFKVAKDSGDKFGSLVAIGAFSMIFSQVFINVGMNLGLLPITGITLPLVSYGGSSIVSTMITLGLVQSIGVKKKSREIEIK